MVLGKNTCQWLTLGSTELCARSCLGTFCKVHLNRLRKGGGTKPCKKCGKGVYNRYLLCSIVDAAGRDCGYAKEKSNDLHRKQYAFKMEARRLALIQLL